MREFLRWLCWWKPPCLLELVIVNRVGDDEAFRGVLWRSRGAWLVLKQAELLVANQQPSPIDGEIIIHRSKVAFIQRLGSP